MDKNKRLAELLATYGADTSRWPAGEVSAFDDRDFDAALRRQRQDAAELDLALDAAPLPRMPEDAVDRLMARVQDAAPPENVVPMPAPGARLPRAERPWLSPSGLALLAASLLLGVYLGQADFMTSLVGDSIIVADGGSADAFSEAADWLSFDADGTAEETL